MTNQVRILPRCVAQIIRWKGNRDIKLSDTKKHSDQLKLCAYNIKAILQRLMVNWRGPQGKNHCPQSRIRGVSHSLPLLSTQIRNKQSCGFGEETLEWCCIVALSSVTLLSLSLITLQCHSLVSLSCVTLFDHSLVSLVTSDSCGINCINGLSENSKSGLRIMYLLHHHPSLISSSNTMKWHCTEHYNIW